MPLTGHQWASCSSQAQGTEDSLHSRSMPRFSGVRLQKPGRALSSADRQLSSLGVLMKSRSHKRQTLSRAPRHHQSAQAICITQREKPNGRGNHGGLVLSLPWFVRSGSIIVDHNVVVEAIVNNHVSIIDGTIQNVTEAVRDQLNLFNSTETNCSEGE